MTSQIEESVRIRPGVAGGVAPDKSYYLLSWPYSTGLGRLSTEQQALLHRLSQASVPVKELAELDFEAHLSLLRVGGWLHVTVTCDGRDLYTVEPEGPEDSRVGETPADLALSRFAIARRDGTGVVLESPRSWCRVRLHDSRALAWLGPSRLADDDVPALRRLRRDLWACGLAVLQADDEDDRLSTSQWQPHELWFHHRSRTHLPEVPHGKSAWAAGRFAAPAAHREPFDGEVVDLARPDLSRLRAGDPSLTAALEQRRSIRRHDDANPLTAAELGEFLYRCARNRDVYRSNGVDHVSRPYPAGGAMHELEIYPVIWKVSGLEQGLYHYDPQHHRLERICGATLEVRRLLRAAAASAAADQEPQVLLVIAARFGRVMWSYQSMAYSLIMKHVGVLFQTMYLVATAMGLAPCALGGGDAAAFAAATRLDAMEEGTVGEFALGSVVRGAGR
ncbi:SagB-type dehydrogenase family enzyme [Nonomuraea polychroma]|uniref:SagB-type dehydrogenase family enzyme n=1 Tax=Nonomuraea polychroma TaxID=46176 RepID=A0A438MGM4_9ACTN|nr:SagB family peptide dehydrogenase [Nonomuraea polychroma]RVX44992.1 SagB-type dehydrogenase family enzyme [Nonomuraea polychroma]